MMKTIHRFLPISLIILLVGCALFGEHEPEATLALHEQVNPASPETHVQRVEVPKTGLTIPIDPYPMLTEKNAESAEFQRTAGGGAAILLHFDTHGVMVLREMTTRSRGDYIVIFLNGRPVA